MKKKRRPKKVDWRRKKTNENEMRNQKILASIYGIGQAQRIQ